MWVGREGWKLESLEGKDRANSSHHDFPHLGGGIFLKALDLWMCGVGELREPVTGLLVGACPLPSSLPLHTSGQAFHPLAGSASPVCYIWEKARKLRHTSFFQLLNPTPQGKELNADQITIWMKTSWWLMFSVEFQEWAKLVLRLCFFDYLCICLFNLNAG